MINMSKCFKVSLVSLLIFGSISDGLEVMASSLNSDTTNVQTEIGGDVVSEENVSDKKISKEEDTSSELENHDETEDFETYSSDANKVNTKSETIEEHLGNEPPILSEANITPYNIAGKMDWRVLKDYYRVNIAGSEVNEPAGVWFTVGGETVFCVAGKIAANKDENYEFSEYLTYQQKYDIALITYFGFTTQTHDDAHYMATQIAIWEYMGEIVSFPYSAWKAEYTGIKNYINKKIDWFNDSASFNGETIELYGIGKDFSKTVIDDNNYINDCHLSILSDYLEYEKSGNSLKVWAKKFQNVGTERIDFKLVPDEYIGEPIVMSGTGGSQPVINAKKMPDPGRARLNVNMNIKAPVKITKKDAVSNEVIKQAGVKYDIYSTDGTYITTATSGSDGVATSIDLEYGNYYYIERKAPSNYQLNIQPVYFNIEVDKSIKGYEYVSSEIKDQRVTGKITINKEDEETGKTPQGDATLDGAVYGLYAGKDIVSPDTNKVVYTKDTLIRQLTIKDLQATADGLYLGEYYLKEIKAPTGYNLSNKVYPVTLSYKDQTTAVVEVELTVTDKVITAPLEITKKDIDTGNAVRRAGVEFEVYTKHDVKIGTIVTNDQGIATLPKVPYGFNYYFIETKAPVDYTINRTKVPFNVTKNGVTVKKSISNKRVTATLNLEKLDADYGKYNQGDANLENTEYILYAKSDILRPDTLEVKFKKDQPVATLTIHNFKASVSDLYLGSYYLKESKPGEGYVLSDKATDITFTYTNQETAIEIRNVEVTDQVAKQAFRIAKFSSDGDAGPTPALKDAEFTFILHRYVKQYGSFDKALAVAKANDGRIKPSEWGVITTDEQGMATSKKLPYGYYIVHETKVPANVEASSDFYVDIKKNSDVPQNWVYVNDPLYKTVLAVVKLDAETGKTVKLPGTTFRIKCLSDNADFKAGEYVGWWVWSPLPHYQDTFETTDDGSFMTPEKLNPGTYQLEEISAPNGYLVSKTSKPFVIKKNDMHQQVGPDNTTIVTTVSFGDYAVKGQVKVDKQAELFKGYDFRQTEYGKLYEPIYETGMLPNVKFEIKAKTDIIGKDGTLWYKKGRVIETLTTDGKNITVSSLLPIGAENLYTLQEVETEEGYVLDDTIYTFRFDYVDDETEVVTPTWLDEDGNEIESEEVKTLNNEKQVSLAGANKQLEQSDITDTSNAYQDVVFGLYTDNVNGLEKDSLVGISDINLDGDLGFEITQKGVYYMTEIATNPLFVKDTTKYPFTFDYNGDKITTIEINDGKVIYNYLKRGTVVILKSDKLTGKPLVNVKFELAIDKDFKDIIKTTATGVDGRALFEELEVGHTYYIREKYDGVHDMVVEGYVYDPTVHEVIINEDQQVIKLTLENQPVRGKVQFAKTGETFNDIEIVEGEFGTETHPVWKETALLGSELTIYAAEDITTWDGTTWYEKDEAVLTLESDWEMSDSVTLPVGKYYAKETKVPHGYVCDPNTYTFEITKNGLAEIQLNPISIFNNRAHVDINMTKALEKQDVFVNANAYKDVVFGLYAREDIYNYMGQVLIENGTLLGTSHIDEKGHLINSYDLPIGTYFFKELATNDQYVLDTNEYDFEIAYQGQDVNEYTVDILNGETIHNLLKRGSVEILKVDKESNKPLVNVPFELATDKAFKNVIKTTVTGEDGTALFDELEKGTYYIREVYNGEHDMVVEGYVKDDTIHTAVINDDKQVIEITAKNQPVKGTAAFTKRGETFNDVEIVDGVYGKETRPVWKETALLGAELTIYAAEEIITWDGTQWYKKDQEVLILESDWDTVTSTQLPVGKYYAKETKVPHGYIVDPTVYEFEITPNGKADIQINPVSIYNKRAKANIDFTKILENQEIFVNTDAYKDVVFGLYAREDIYDYMGNVLIKNNTLIKTSGIDKKGHLLETVDLPNGAYYYKELATNNQYVLDDKEYDFEIAYQGQNIKEYTVEINDGDTIENELIRGTIEVVKYTNDNVYYSSKETVSFATAASMRNENIWRNQLLHDEFNYLYGVSFELATDKDFTNIIKVGSTDLDGRLVFDNLEKGTYFIREKRSLDFYEVNDSTFEVTIERNDQFETVEVDNTLISSFVMIEKVDADDNNKRLSNATFALYSDSDCTKEIEKQTTNEYGIAMFTGIKFGTTVYIKEISAPTGYELSKEVHEITINEDWVNGDSKTRTLTIANKKIPPVVTGDDTSLLRYTALLALSCSMILMAIMAYKRKKKYSK